MGHSLLRYVKNVFRSSTSICIKSYRHYGKDWSVDDVAKHLSKAEVNKILVMAGAGISTPSGIPDFRTPGTGLYDSLQKYDLPYPEAIFDIDFFHQNPQPFYTLAKQLYPGNFLPNIAHNFCKLLQDKNKLLRMYTQNIDGLERLAGIVPEKLVESHGSFFTAKCTKCQKSYVEEEFKDQVMAQQIPKCSSCNGVIKPDIVFFGENLPERFFLHTRDVMVADTLIIMGTSLEVEPFASIANMVEEDVPRILINKTPVRSFVTSDTPSDVLMLGDLEDNIKILSDKLGWRDELEKLNGKFSSKKN
ncbi:NAD-dependent protein deacetylase sirtuin-3, mitochondrial [Chamberlinius hualienensis]